MSEATFTEWKQADGYRWREKLSGFECINDGENIAGDFCDLCGDCIVCFGDWSEDHACYVIEYE